MASKEIHIDITGVRAYRDAREWAATHGHPQPDDRMIDDVLAAALAIVEREHEIEIARLRARIKQAQESRNHWVRRALDAEERSAAPAPEAGAGHHAAGTACRYPECECDRDYPCGETPTLAAGTEDS